MFVLLEGAVRQCIWLGLLLWCCAGPVLSQRTHPCRFCPAEPEWAEPEPARRLLEGPSKIVIDLGSPRQTLQAWGTSLCWWANGVGQWTNKTRLGELLGLVFSDFSAESLHQSIRSGAPLPESLGLTQARYNIGGGEDPKYKHFMRDGGAVEGYQAADGSWDWQADASQRAVLAGALQRGLRIVHAFSNSPPAWMTKSGSATGAKGGSSNLKDESYDAFALYLATVVKRFATDPALLGGRTLVFDAVTPINEPSASWWKFGNNQEGCHFSPQQQSAILAKLAEQLRGQGVSHTPVSGAEENWVDGTVESVKAYSDEVVGVMPLVTTHTYGASDGMRAALAKWAKVHGKALWNSEFGTGSGPLQGGIQLAHTIAMDLAHLNCTVWTLWQVADLDNTLGPSGWGGIAATYQHRLEDFKIRKQYYSYKQFSAFIRPGSTVLSVTSQSSDVSAVAALLPIQRRDGAEAVLVLVAANNATAAVQVPVSFAGAQETPSVTKMSAYLTDETHDCAPVLPPAHEGDEIALVLPQRSIMTLVIDLARGVAAQTPRFV